MTGNIDWTFKVGDLITVGGLGIGFILFLFRRGGDYQKLQMAMDAAAAEIAHLKQEISKVGEILTKVAVQNERMDNMAMRQNLMDRRMDELRRGRGFIQGNDGVDHEYP